MRGLASGIDRLNFFGFGNDTPDIEERDVYKVNQMLYRVTPTVNWSRGKDFEVLFGVGVQFSQEKDENSFIDLVRPYGWGDFAQLNLVTALEWDTRGLQRAGLQSLMAGEIQPAGAKKKKRYTGLRIRVGAQYSPEVWDLEEDFGGVQGSISGYLGLGSTERVVLARAGRRPADLRQVPVVRGGLHRRCPQQPRLPGEPLRRRQVLLRQLRASAAGHRHDEGDPGPALG